MSNITIGIDLGGSNIAATALTPDMQIIGRAKKKTKKGDSLSDTAQRMRQVAEEAMKNADKDWNEAEAIGVAVPSSVDPETGMILHAPNLGWQNEEARPIFQECFERDVSIENDVNCGTLAEFRAGAGKGCKHMAGFFVGTGLGGGLILNKQLFTGKKGAAAELGHQVVKYGGRQCNCGKEGCLEAYASKTGFGKKFAKLLKKDKYKDSMLMELTDGDVTNVRSGILKKCYRADDKVVTRTLQKGCYILGLGVANTIVTLAPDRVVFGGGVMEALGEELLPFVKDGVRENIFGLEFSDVELCLAELGDDSVPMGAAILAKELHETKKA